MDNRPIGVFDSGVGGLTVVKEIIRQLPNENIVYFGDSARVPYGTKTADTVTKYSSQNIRFLISKGVKAIIIACNTASALSLNKLKTQFDIPIIGVVLPGAVSAVSKTQSKNIGIIGTKATINSRAYEIAIKNIDKQINTFGIACPLFVPLVEEGWLDNEITYKTTEVYLNGFKGKNIDTLILGCTHYPLLKSTIGKVIGENITLVNPAFETAIETKNILTKNNLLRDEKERPIYKYYLSDTETNFAKVANICLNKNIKEIQKVDIEQF
jgi:glutamate racemase